LIHSWTNWTAGWTSWTAGWTSWTAGWTSWTAGWTSWATGWSSWTNLSKCYTVVVFSLLFIWTMCLNEYINK